jgi:hypothetical protein
MARVALDERGLAFVPVFIKPFDDVLLEQIDFKLDTGATITTVSKTSLTSLGYSESWIDINKKMHPTMTLESAGHKAEPAYYIRISKANFFGRDLIDWPFYIRPEHDRNYRNLLGVDIFSKFDFTYQFSTGYLEIVQIMDSVVQTGMLDGQSIEEVKS